MIFYRERDVCNAVNAHRNGLALASEVPGKFFLRLDYVFKHRVVNRLSGNNERYHIRTDVFKFCVYIDNSVSEIFNVTLTRHKRIVINRFSAFVKFQLACNAVCRPQVRAVRVVKFDFNYAFVFRLCHIRLFVKFRLCVGEFLLQCIIVIFFIKKIKKELFVYFNFWHCFPLSAAGRP